MLSVQPVPIVPRVLLTLYHAQLELSILSLEDQVYPSVLHVQVVFIVLIQDLKLLAEVAHLDTSLTEVLNQDMKIYALLDLNALLVL